MKSFNRNNEIMDLRNAESNRMKAATRTESIAEVKGKIKTLHSTYDQEKTIVKKFDQIRFVADISKISRLSWFKTCTF